MLVANLQAYTFSTTSLDSLSLTSSSVTLADLDMNNTHLSLKWCNWKGSLKLFLQYWREQVDYMGNKPHSCGTLHSLSPSENRYKNTWRLYPWKPYHSVKQDHLLWFFQIFLGFFWPLVGYSDVLSNVVGFISSRNKYFEDYKCITIL